MLLLEAYVDDFIQLAQTTNPAQLLHCSRALLHGIHSVFPPPAVTGHSGKDLVLMKKLLEGKGMCDVCKEILGWVMDGSTLCIELAEKKQAAILKELKTVLRINRNIPFKRAQKLVGKLRHAAVGIPAGKALFVPINQLMAIEPKRIVWDRCLVARQAFQAWHQLIQEAAKEPTYGKELISEGKGAGGIWISGNRTMTPVVWRVKWPRRR